MEDGRQAFDMDHCASNKTYSNYTFGVLGQNCCRNNLKYSTFHNCVFNKICFCSEVINYCKFIECVFIKCSASSSLTHNEFSKCTFRGTSFRGSVLRNAFLECSITNDVAFGSPSMFLLNYWRGCSKELTRELMCLDAHNHPDPEQFNTWARDPRYGICPYMTREGKKIDRMANFQEEYKLWSPDLITKPPKSCYELMQMIIKEKFIKIE